MASISRCGRDGSLHRSSILQWRSTCGAMMFLVFLYISQVSASFPEFSNNNVGDHVSVTGDIIGASDHTEPAEADIVAGSGVAFYRYPVELRNLKLSTFIKSVSRKALLETSTSMFSTYSMTPPPPPPPPPSPQLQAPTPAPTTPATAAPPPVAPPTPAPATPPSPLPPASPPPPAPVPSNPPPSPPPPHVNGTSPPTPAPAPVNGTSPPSPPPPPVIGTSPPTPAPAPVNVASPPTPAPTPVQGPSPQRSPGPGPSPAPSPTNGNSKPNSSSSHGLSSLTKAGIGLVVLGSVTFALGVVLRYCGRSKSQ